MSSAHNPVSSFAADPSGDVLVATAQQALSDWRAAFDSRLEALENALQHPGPDLPAIMLEFARAAGEEAEASARHASLEAHVGARASAKADQQALEEAFENTRAELARAQQRLDEMRQAVEGTRRAHEETRRALEDARHGHEPLRQAVEAAQRAAAEAEARAREGDDERRELMGIQTQLTGQLAEARDEAQATRAMVVTLQQQLADSAAAAENQSRELVTFRRRLEQAVRDAEERSRVQEHALQEERARLERVAHEAAARNAADVARVTDQLAAVSREAATLRPQVQAAQQRIAGLELEVQTRGRVIAELQETLKAVRAERAAAATPAALPTSPAKPIPAPAASAPSGTPPPATLSAPPAPVRALPDPAPAAMAPTGEATAPAISPSAPASAPPTSVSTPPAVAAPPPSQPAVGARTTDAPAASPLALEWLQSLQAAPRVDGAAVVAAHASAPEAVAADAPGSATDSTMEDADDRPESFFGDDDTADPLSDAPLSPDGNGVFSTVADALRAWATETDALHAHEPAPPRGHDTTASAAPQSNGSSANSSSSRPTHASSEWDLVRQSVRHDLSSLRITVTVDNDPGVLVDLSTGGAQVVSSAMLKPGRQVRVTFPASGPLATGKAKVAWSRLEPPSQGGGELQYRAGLTFTKIEQRTIDKVLGVTAPDAKR